MGYSVELVDDGEFIRLVFAGETTAQDHEDARAEAFRALTSRGWKRLLVDARQISTRMSLFDDYEFTKEHQSSLPLLARVAAIHRHDESERFRFIENVAVNRGHNLKVFTDPGEAIDWLIDE